MKNTEGANNGKERRFLAQMAAVVMAAAGLSALTAGPVAACSILPPQMPPALQRLPEETDDQFQARFSLHVDGFNALQRQRTRDAAEERQKSMWNEAEKAAVVELVSLQTGLEIPNMMMGRGSRATLRPVGWIKGGETMRGRAGRTAFVLAHTSYTSCGPSPNWPVFYGKPGDRFVVMFRSGGPGQQATLDVFRPGEIVFGDLVTALATQVR